MLLYLEGWDHIATTDLPLLYTNPSGGSPGVVNSGSGRFAGNSFSPTTARRAISATLVSGSPAGLIFGFACINPSNGVILTLYNAALAVMITVNYVAAGSYITVNDASGDVIASSTPNSVQLGSWFYLEVKVAGYGVGQAVSMQIDGNSAGAGTGNTGTLGTPNNNFYYEFESNAGTVDDNYWFDTSAGVQDGFAGVRRVDTRFVSGDGRVNQWSVSGAGANYLAVADPTPDYDTTYVVDSNPGDTDCYTLAAPSQEPDSVAGVQVDVLCRRDGTDLASLSIGIGNGATEEYRSTNTALSLGYEYTYWALDSNPFTSAAWAPADVNTLQIAVQNPE